MKVANRVGLTVKTGIKGGRISLNHSQRLVRVGTRSS